MLSFFPILNLLRISYTCPLPPNPFFTTSSVFLSAGMLWQGVALCYTELRSPSAYYPVRLNTQVETKENARKLQLTSRNTQHNSLTHMKTSAQASLTHI